MAFSKVEPDIVMERLLHVFRSVGYDGASLTELASATGLKKASLYHRFPDGKVGMARAVLDHVKGWDDSQIFYILLSSEPAKERLDAALNAISVFYEGGRLACILRAMSHGAAAEIFRDQIAETFQNWVNAFAHLATDLGHDSDTAQKLGESSLVKIQGSLILAQTLQKPELFQDALEAIKTDFLK
ncbi:TetR/AcrR family transcriptional regulator [Dyadobacter sp. CY326]|uniref:TetR/AcrR family transcriptional regulator n=1 Tax=Dyadobacter sp. CY326 TaxID=2907300 RepID=UPI001F2FAC49|nr:TetR/AcrR family transcriptional regulator [Dyadobacter sp. CY326]MCE7065106.1 TetR/AcrR family transcriptional regulator [Dyadobacter sp. CY326]